MGIKIKKLKKLKLGYITFFEQRWPAQGKITNQVKPMDRARPRLKSGFNPQRTQPMQPKTRQLVQLNLLKTRQRVQLNQLKSLPNMERIKVLASSSRPENR